MYALVMTALVSVDAQSQAWLFQRFHQRKAYSSCGCVGSVSCGCYSVCSCPCSGSCGGQWISAYSGCFSYCQTTCGCYGCSVPVVLQPIHTHVPTPAPSGPPLAGAPSADPALTAANESERDAVRQLLRTLREKKTAPLNPTPPIPIPPVPNPKLDVPPPPGLSTSAKLSIRLPETAKLWVDGVECPLTGDLRSFKTPTLEPGVEYAYTLRIAVERDGTMAMQERVVQFAAGKQIDVDFGSSPSATAQR